MRIIAGKYRGKVLCAIRGDAVRPTSDRVKESVFQILSERLRGARVLDLFCGSGALGIESLSRGAREAVFNDASAESLALLKKNLVRVDEPREIFNLDFLLFLKTAKGPFDLIFADPPYREDYLPAIAAIVSERLLLREGGLLIYEGEREEETPRGFRLADRRRYGRTIIDFWEMTK